MSDVPDYQKQNRREWDARSDDYQRRHGELLDRAPDAWGVWRIPETELRALGDVAGSRVLELGCGAAQWSVALAHDGARCTGMDLSGTQLSHARREVERAGVAVDLVQASAAALPFAGESYDIVFCDHGAMSFADPYDVVPQVARVLRSGGLFVFCISSPIFLMCHHPVEDVLTEQLHFDYFGMRRFEWPDSIDFQIPYGEWLALFRREGFEVEDLIEIRAPEDATSTYRDDAEREWARRWPMEDLWRVRKG